MGLVDGRAIQRPSLVFGVYSKDRAATDVTKIELKNCWEANSRAKAFNDSIYMGPLDSPSFQEHDKAEVDRKATIATGLYPMSCEEVSAV